MDRFQYFNPADEKLPVIAEVRAAYASLLETIQRCCPASREASVSITELETSAMWAIKAIVLPRE